MDTITIFALLTSCLVISSASACTKGDKTAVDGACNQYLECNEDGQLVRKTCSFGHAFDPSKKDCEWKWNVKCYEKPAECEAGKVYAHPDSCRLYYYCVNGTLTVQFCPLAKIFDPALGQCKYGWSCNKVECVASESRVVAGECSSYELCEDGKWNKHQCGPGLSFDPISQTCKEGACAQCTEGDLRKAKACNRYEECSHGIWSEKKCFWAKRFDPAKKSCVWFFQYTCPKTTNLLNLVGTCIIGDTRAEDDCSKYSLCVNGSWSIQACPDGYLFDSVKFECVTMKEAKCMSCPTDMANEKSCGSYYICDQGKKVPKSCGFMKKWDGVTKKCVYFGAHCFPGDSCTEEGKKLPADDCKHYKQCISRKYYKQSCGFSRIFDSDKNKCVWVFPWNKCDSNSLIKECSEGETRLLNCDQYVKCVDGSWEHQQCKSGDTFANGACIEGECTVQKKSCREYSVNGVDLECVQGEVFDEKTRQCQTGTCNDCKQGEMQPIDCKRYKICEDGLFVEKSCSNCTNFNQKDGICSFLWDYPCKNGETVTSETPATDTPTTPRPCNEGEKIPSTENCRQYYVCEKGKLIEDSCLWPRKFDSVEMKCVWFNAKCAQK